MGIRSLQIEIACGSASPYEIAHGVVIIGPPRFEDQIGLPEVAGLDLERSKGCLIFTPGSSVDDGPCLSTFARFIHTGGDLRRVDELRVQGLRDLRGGG